MKANADLKVVRERKAQLLTQYRSKRDLKIKSLSIQRSHTFKKSKFLHLNPDIEKSNQNSPYYVRKENSKTKDFPLPIATRSRAFKSPEKKPSRFLTFSEKRIKIELGMNQVEFFNGDESNLDIYEHYEVPSQKDIKVMFNSPRSKNRFESKFPNIESRIYTEKNIVS